MYAHEVLEELIQKYADGDQDVFARLSGITKSMITRCLLDKQKRFTVTTLSKLAMNMHLNLIHDGLEYSGYRLKGKTIQLELSHKTESTQRIRAKKELQQLKDELRHLFTETNKRISQIIKDYDL